MKKLLILLCSLSICFYCGSKQEEVERIMEDGVEVVINHLEPYKIEGEPKTLTLDEEFIIDTEMDKIANIGLTDLRCFDVDSQGNIYLLKMGRGKGNNIFKFDKTGRFVSSFGITGQGPGEFVYPRHLEIDNQERLLITDPGKSKLIIFDSNGEFIKEIKTEGIKISCLENGKFLALEQQPGSYMEEYIQFPFKLLSTQFEELKELDRFRILNSNLTKKRRGTAPIWGWSSSKKGIYVGNEDRGYEIWVYDLEGNLYRKIKKEFKSVPVSEEYKNKMMERANEQLKKITFFPDYFPPYQSFFADDNGRLFVMTYEVGDNPREFIFDIFNAEGVFIGRKSLNVWVNEGFVWGMIKEDLFYCLQEKESGYKELVVYKMKCE
jgi:hypothetical protein